jgi:membrane protein DedA with SNARE-associated domain
MPVVRFAIVDAIACVIGALVFAGLGYGVSGSATVLLGHVRRVQFWLLGALVVGAVLVVLIHLAAKRELHLEDPEQ